MIERYLMQHLKAQKRGPENENPPGAIKFFGGLLCKLGWTIASHNAEIMYEGHINAEGAPDKIKGSSDMRETYPGI